MTTHPTDNALDELLSKPVVINFKEDSVPSLRGGTLESFCKMNLEKQLLEWSDKRLAAELRGLIGSGVVPVTTRDVENRLNQLGGQV